MRVPPFSTFLGGGCVSEAHGRVVSAWERKLSFLVKFSQSRPLLPDPLSESAGYSPRHTARDAGENARVSQQCGFRMGLLAALRFIGMKHMVGVVST